MFLVNSEGARPHFTILRKNSTWNRGIYTAGNVNKKTLFEIDIVLFTKYPYNMDPPPPRSPMDCPTQLIRIKRNHRGTWGIVGVPDKLDKVDYVDINNFI